MTKPFFGISATNDAGVLQEVPGVDRDGSADLSSPRTAPREAATAAPPFPRKYVRKYVRSYVRKYLPVVSLPLFSRLATPRPHSSSVCGVRTYLHTYVRTYVRTRWSRGLRKYARTHARTNHSMVWESWRGGQAAQDPPGSSSGLLIRPARPHPPQARTDPIDPFKARARTPRLGPATGTPTHPKAWA